MRPPTMTSLVSVLSDALSGDGATLEEIFDQLVQATPITAIGLYEREIGTSILDAPTSSNLIRNYYWPIATSVRLQQEPVAGETVADALANLRGGQRRLEYVPAPQLPGSDDHDTHVIVAFPASLGPAKREQVDAILPALSRAVPVARRALSERRWNSLHRLVGRQLRRFAMTRSASDESPVLQLGAELNSVCSFLAEAMMAHEVTILWQDESDVDTLRVGASNRLDELITHTYDLADSSPSPYIFNENATLICDLSTLPTDDLPLTPMWARSLGPQGLLEAALEREIETLPPLPFVGVPIEIAGTPIGVLRASLRLSAPYRFTTWQADQLTEIAGQIAMMYKFVSDESRRSQLVHKLDTLTHNSGIGVTASTDALGTSEDPFLPNIVTLLEGVLPLSDPILDIRLLDREHDDFHFAAVGGRAWQEGTVEQQRVRRTKRFGRSNPSLASHLAERPGIAVYEFPFPSTNPDSRDWYDETFEDIAHMFVAALSFDGEVVGYVDVRTRTTPLYPDEIRSILRLVANFLSVHLRAAKLLRDLGELRRQQDQVIEDFHHQVGGPAFLISNAIRELEQLMKHYPSPASASTGRAVGRQMALLRSVAGQLDRVAKLITTLKELAAGQAVRLNAEQMQVRDVHTLFTRATRAVRLSTHASVQVQLADPVLSGRFRGALVEVDGGKLEQVAHNVIENAVKYSYKGSSVQVGVFGASSGELVIEVSNLGLGFLRSELTRVFERGFRGHASEYSDGEGGGVGLWLSNQIVEAHGGTMRAGTDSAGRTRVRVSIPMLGVQS